MGRADHLELGTWNVVCYQCGFKRKASMMEKNWQGYYVCPEHNEPRQVQDFVRAIPDNQNVPWSQPAISPVYVFADVKVGTWDGINKRFQLGDGLYPTTVTEVKTDGTFLPGIYYSTTFLGGIICNDLLTLPNGTVITASGTETVT